MLNYIKIKKYTLDGYDNYIGCYKDTNSKSISNIMFGYDAHHITEFLYNRLKKQGIQCIEE
jgi:hypothetical protein